MQVHQLVATAMDPLVPSTEPEEPITVTPEEIIYHRRLRVMEHARRTSVSEACRTFGVFEDVPSSVELGRRPGCCSGSLLSLARGCDVHLDVLVERDA